MEQCKECNLAIIVLGFEFLGLPDHAGNGRKEGCDCQLSSPPSGGTGTRVAKQVAGSKAQEAGMKAPNQRLAGLLPASFRSILFSAYLHRSLFSVTELILKGPCGRRFSTGPA